MPTFSQRSKERLKTCHPDIVKVLELAITKIDFAVICGHRTKEEQDLAVLNKTTKLAWPNSKHNKKPSLAVDIIPHPFSASMWNQITPWQNLANVVLQCADELGVNMRWGGDWDKDGQTKDEKFFDGPHFELI